MERVRKEPFIFSCQEIPPSPSTPIQNQHEKKKQQSIDHEEEDMTTITKVDVSLFDLNVSTNEDFVLDCNNNNNNNQEQGTELNLITSLDVANDSLLESNNNLVETNISTTFIVLVLIPLRCPIQSLTKHNTTKNLIVFVLSTRLLRIDEQWAEFLGNYVDNEVEHNIDLSDLESDEGEEEMDENFDEPVVKENCISFN
ncbi:hypothetical protein RYX36_022378 [Vicia faba]